MRRVLVAVLAAVGLTAGPARADLIYANVSVVGGTRLVSFDSAAPGIILSDVAVTDGTQSVSVEAIDFRPATGQLYALASGGTGASSLARIDPTTGQATAVPLTGDPLILGSFGTYGFDFNPVADALRVVSPNAANYRITFATPTVNVNQDANVAFAPGDPNFGQSPTIVGSAYTNNVAGATSTTLYGIEVGTGALVTQAPPNAGTLNTVGPLGIAGLGTLVGFDITADNRAFLSNWNSTTGRTQLYSVNLATGESTLLGDIGDGQVGQIRGIAVAPFAPAAVPEPASLVLLGVGAAGVIGARLRRRKVAAA